MNIVQQFAGCESADGDRFLLLAEDMLSQR